MKEQSPLEVTLAQAIKGMVSSYNPNVRLDVILDMMRGTTPEILEPKQRPLLKLKDVAEMLGFTRVHISRLANAGELTRINISCREETKTYRICPDSVVAFLERRKVATKLEGVNNDK